MGGVWKCWLRGGGKGRKGNARCGKGPLTNKLIISTQIPV